MKLFLLLLSVIGIVMLGFVFDRAAKIKLNRAILHCLPLLYAMIGQLQKHRGTTAGYLQGNTQAKKTLNDIQRQVASIKSELSTYPVLISMERWVSFVDHWSRLKESCFSLSVEASFHQHSAMIENLLYLLEDLADTAPIVADHKRYSNEQINLLWRDLPLLAECIGQSRAVAMPVAVKGEANQIDKVKIAYLRDKIASISASVFKQLKTAPSSQHTSQAIINVASESCVQFVDTLNHSFLDAKKVVITPDDYFNVASTTMNAVNDIFKIEIDAFTKAH
jgi:hypothetical protein